MSPFFAANLDKLRGGKLNAFNIFGAEKAVGLNH